MSLHFTHPWYLLLLIPGLGWTIYLAFKSDVQTGRVRRWVATTLRSVVVICLVFALAGLQWRISSEGMNVYFLLDRSDSIPAHLQDAAVEYVNQTAAQRKISDRAGVIVFGADAGIEQSLDHDNGFMPVEKIQGVVDASRTDLAAALRLGTAAFPETGQKRLIVLTDGNETSGEALSAAMAAIPLKVSIEVMPMGSRRGADVSIRQFNTPNRVKKGQTFDAKLFLSSDVRTKARIRIYRNDQHIGDKEETLEPGKNLFTFSETLPDEGFYRYTAQVEATGDSLYQNNKASAFVTVRQDPRILMVSEAPELDARLLQVLRDSNLNIEMRNGAQLPESLIELQTYDSIFISNLSAGEIGPDRQKLLESAVRDFGVGLVVIGGDQSFAAGAYRNTPLEAALPVSMELDSKKVLPSGALVLLMHGMEFNNGNQIAREIAQATLEGMGPQDELGVLLWDGTERWLFPLTKVGNKKSLRSKLAGMNQGDLPSFQGLMTLGHKGLKESTSNLKHMIVFSDGDPGAPTSELLREMVEDKITVSSVLISGHAGPETMEKIAREGNGRFYPVVNPASLPQIFLKESAVILKSAIFEGVFTPRKVFNTEVIRGISGDTLPPLKGFVATSPKPRAETPLVTDKGDPLLAHWQYGLGRSVAFTSDARAKWASEWQSWSQYRQFWSQVAQWSLRRLDNADFSTEVSMEDGKGMIATEALDPEGNFRNFLTLQAVVVSPKGNRQTIRMDQAGPGRYEARFPTQEEGVYTIHILDMDKGEPRGSQTVGASINYSPEFNNLEPNLALLRRLADIGGGRILHPNEDADNTFLYKRQKTYSPRDLWQYLLLSAILIFPIDVGVRRVQLEREEMIKAWFWIRRKLLFWKGAPPDLKAEESLGALLKKRDAVRSTLATKAPEVSPELFKPRTPVATITAEPVPSLAPNGVKPIEEEQSQKDNPADVSTTSRLLKAKRKASKSK